MKNNISLTEELNLKLLDNKSPLNTAAAGMMTIRQLLRLFFGILAVVLVIITACFF